MTRANSDDLISQRSKRRYEEEIAVKDRCLRGMGEMTKLDARRLYATITGLLKISNLTIEEIENDPTIPLRIARETIETQSAMRREDS